MTAMLFKFGEPYFLRSTSCLEQSSVITSLKIVIVIVIITVVLVLSVIIKAATTKVTPSQRNAGRQCT